MGFATELRHLIDESADFNKAALHKLSQASDNRVDRLSELSPLYHKLLLSNPGYWLWLEDEKNLNEAFRISAFSEEWNRIKPNGHKEDDFLHELQKYRRKMSLRIAYRDVNGISGIKETLGELSILAEFVLQKLLDYLLERQIKQRGIPWNEDLDEPARFVVLGLGKLGAGELNFCSDVDLIYTYRGQGRCKRDGEFTNLTTQEFYTQLCQKLTSSLSDHSAHGFLYNVDLRLRPDGAQGLIIRSFTAMENYYSLAGQTWERLALIKARPVAGDIALGHELLEDLNHFRYPRSPPPSFLTEISGLKRRIEREVLSPKTLHRNIKTGRGGIREIEFVLQSLQLMHGGSNPFLQIPETYGALEQLRKYNYLESSDAETLLRGYNFLRQLENKLQIQEENQTHTLPNAGTALEVIAKTLGFHSGEDMMETLKKTQQEVNSIYKRFLPILKTEKEMQDWILLLSKNEIPRPLSRQLKEWFGEVENIPQHLRYFILGEHQQRVTRENVSLFIDLSQCFDDLLPKLATPLKTLERISHFAKHYGSRNQFFKTCSLSKHLFHALALLFDRSTFIHQLLCLHPEIFEEVLRSAPNRQKSREDLIKEIQELPEDETFNRYLWLYIKAEQVRLTIQKFIYHRSLVEVELDLANLADATLEALMRRHGLEEEMCVIALGKYGGREISLSSDLDIMFVSEKKGDERVVRLVNQIQKCLHLNHPLGHSFTVDTRLRPYGQDGPVVVTPEAFKIYHEKHGKLWERQLLTRMRYVGGNKHVYDKMSELRDDLIYHKGIDAADEGEIVKMLEHIRSDKLPKVLPERSFKYAPGGLQHIEFFVQIIQMTHGWEHKELQRTSTIELLEAAGKLGYITSDATGVLRKNYLLLSKIQFYVRRNVHRPVSEFDSDPFKIEQVAKWLGYKSGERFMEAYKEVLLENAHILKSLMNEGEKV